MRVIASYKMSRLNIPFRNRLMEYLITRYFEENKIPDTWAEETDTIKEELDIPAQLIISRLFGGWLDAVVNHVNQGTPLTEEELVEYPHQMDDLYDSYSFESDKEYHRDFSGYMDQTAWEFMSKAAEYLTEDEMLATIWQTLSDIGAEVYGTLKVLQPGGAVGLWHSLENYEQQIWQGKMALFAIDSGDYEVLYKGPKAEEFSGSEEAKATAGNGEFFFIWNGKLITYGNRIVTIPTGDIIEACELNGDIVSSIERASE
ncbi:hypothetical protein PHOBOS_201 [Erwinia phage vB_EamM_Phobos]|uniref:hypothetical protein n=1 Tax=Erwinia phage vB_EamM_Phobos TaxID=1883377 RepID=UPI00081C7A16|nr:hypothetical protein BIZ79_gp201 [Erwinia phage vB_EamM_Phobos]ANZ50391.1 hypothetical protein PHOBOS_201 [Erwinia phage vB_EamM_Phobos]